MTARALVLLGALAAASAPAVADTLILPVFAHNAVGADGARWSSELYLTNPGGQPVQVALQDLLPGYAVVPEPCRTSMTQIRVVPPTSAVVWTATGLSSDLGCASEALGALVLNVDGPLVVGSRLVRHREGGDHASFLSGVGQDFTASPVAELPSAGSYLLPALLWQGGPEAQAAYTVSMGFANPGGRPVAVTLAAGADSPLLGLRLDDASVDLPYLLEVPPGTWRQIRLRPTAPCNEVEPSSFSLLLTTDGPLAMYASVVDRGSQDPRTVLPVPLR